MLASNFVGEFAGTCTLTLFGCGVVAAVILKQSKAYQAGWMVIAAGWGFAVMLAIFVAEAAGAPSADINPAVTLARYFLQPGIYTVTQVAEYSVAEILGGCLGAIIVWLAFLSHWKVTDDKLSKLAVFATIPAIRSYPANLLTEIIGTMALIVCLGALTGWAHPHTISVGIGPYLVGVLVWAIGLSLGGPTGYAINPARDLGPRIAHAILPIAGKGGSDWAYAWVPIAGPIIGSLIGIMLCKAIFY
ncbi:MAG: MIP/aquaporin family protein [Gammaproteobacteria bacterium]|nr:MIP/aquaporin family protein [Gammaproteobacteria bacterium]